MSYLNKSFIVNKVEELSETKTSGSSCVKSAGVGLTCGRCAMLYADYKNLLEHLYWRHGTESFRCTKCSLKQWRYAPHVCYVLPINDDEIEGIQSAPICPRPMPVRESDYCSCGKFIEDSPMIGCDDPQCSRQWYHFKCVGISLAPSGDWFCRECKLKQQLKSLTEVQYSVFIVVQCLFMEHRHV